MSLRSVTCFLVATAAIAVLPGCSESGPKTIPVYGKITFVGRDAPATCKIYFTPMKGEAASRPTFADRQSNGSYKAKSYSTSRGILPGTYHVRVMWYDLKPGKDPNKEMSWDELSFDDGELEVDANSGGIEHNVEVIKKG